MSIISHMGIDYDSPNVEIQDNAYATDLDNIKVPTGQTIKSYISSKAVKVVKLSVSLTSNANVSPFKSYAETNVSQYANENKIVAISVIQAASTNPCVVNVFTNSSNQTMLRVYGSTTATANVQVILSYYV